jgi:type VI protein secretion system component Hcp
MSDRKREPRQPQPAEPDDAEVEDLEPTDEDAVEVRGGADGKVQMNDFHFVKTVDKASPML